MKKSIILMAGLVGLALTSCDDKSDLGTMQKNEAPVVVPADGVAIKSLYGSTGNQISLQDYEESVHVPLINIALSTSFPESSVVTGEVEIADNAEFNNAKTIALTSEAVDMQFPELNEAISGETRMLQGFVTVDAWEEVFTSFYGLNPAPNVNYLRYKLWLTDDTQKVILYNNGNEYYDPMEFMVTPLDAGLDVNSEYWFNYQVGSGSVQSMEMYHNPDKHVYDDPNFSSTVEVPEGETLFWWISTESNGNGMVYGVGGEDPAAESGLLAKADDADLLKGQIGVAGTYKVDADMLSLAYSVKLAPNSLYVMYTNAAFDNVAQLGTSDFETYEGMAGILNNWCLTGQANYKPTIYVNDSSVETVTSGNTTTGGLLYSNDGVQAFADNPISYGNHAGLFYITANLTTQKYTRYNCNTIGVVGSLTNWGNADSDGNVMEDIALKGSRSTLFMVWTGTVTLTEGDEWKIRANNEWTVDFGGANGGSYATDGSQVELAKGGANLVAAESGTYTVTVYFKRQFVDGAMTPYYMTVTPAN